jgi:hypothetical protein
MQGGRPVPLGDRRQLGSTRAGRRQVVAGDHDLHVRGQQL